MSQIYTVTFNPAIDCVMQLKTPLKRGAVNRSAEEAYQFGGKGINVSAVLKELGYESTALGFIAGFTGDALEQGLRAAGMKTDFIRLREGMTRINAKVKEAASDTAEKAEETEINGCGPVISTEALQAFYGRLDGLNEGDLLVLSGSIPGSLPADTYEKIMEYLQDKGIRIVVDASRDLLVNVLKYRPFLIKPNNHELSEIIGEELNTDEALVNGARKLQELGSRNILVSMAGDGALLLDEAGAVHRIGCPSGTVKNSVGAGDSMVAGFLAGYLKSGSFEEALKLGTAAGSATAFSLGLAKREEILELLERI